MRLDQIDGKPSVHSQRHQTTWPEGKSWSITYQLKGYPKHRPWTPTGFKSGNGPRTASPLLHAHKPIAVTAKRDAHSIQR